MLGTNQTAIESILQLTVVTAGVTGICISRGYVFPAHITRDPCFPFSDMCFPTDFDHEFICMCMAGYTQL